MKKIALLICFVFVIIVLGTKFFEYPEIGLVSVFGFKLGLNWSSFLIFKILMLGSWLFYCLIPEKKD
jgi:hypothetical protein